MKKLLSVLVVFVAIGVAAWLGGVAYVDKFGSRTIAATQPVLVEIPPGSSFRSVVRRLEHEGVVEETLLFRLFVRNRKATGRIQAGEYQLAPGITHQQLLDMLTSGDVMMHQITLVEGQRLFDYLEQLRNHEAVMFDLHDSSPIAVGKLLGIAEKNPEGWIYPDTYRFPRGIAASDLLKKAYRQMQRVLSEEWEQRQLPSPLKTPYEALVLASIIEKETGVAEERDEIAGVFVRRLNKGMRLQTDPTVIYGMGERYQGGISRKDLREPTPYNTYVIRGLPPTPIASPARAAIHAALNPASGKSLYFVAKGDGTHHFSATLSEHNRAVDRYQRRKRREDYRSAPPPTGDKQT